MITHGIGVWRNDDYLKIENCGPFLLGSDNAVKFFETMIDLTKEAHFREELRVIR